MYMPKQYRYLSLHDIDTAQDCIVGMPGDAEPGLFVHLPYLSSIHEKTNCVAILWMGSSHSLGSCLF